MASCPDCGAEITHAEVEDQPGVKVPLEKWTSPDGRERYRVVAFGPPLVVAKLADNSVGEGYPDHRVDCPSHGNGLQP
jgi:hypothetical protein